MTSVDLRPAAESLLAARPGPSARIETDAALFSWLRDSLGVVVPERGCCDEHTAPAEAVARAYFACRGFVRSGKDKGRPIDPGSEPVSVWLASRGFGGKSHLLAALALAEAATLGAEVRVLGGSADQSENVVRYMDAWTARDRVAGLLADQYGGRSAGLTRSRVRLARGGMVDAMAASSKAVRGPHPSRLRVDEADELDVRILDAALGQTMATAGVRAQTVISSTHHYHDGTMTEVLRRAEDNGWPVYRWCYRCTERSEANPTGWLDPAEIERKRAEVPASMFRAEYDLQWPMPESAGFLRREWFGVVSDAPAELDMVARSWDEAATAGAGDYTVGALVGYKDGVWYFLVVVRDRVSPAGVDALMDQCAALDGWQTPILLQQEPGSSGKARVAAHRQRLVGYDVRSASPTGDKVARARPLASAAEAGNVRLLAGPWVRAFLEEVETFPGAHDDQVDAVSWAMIQLAFQDRAHTNASAPMVPEAMAGGLSMGDRRTTRHRPGGGAERYRRGR